MSFQDDSSRDLEIKVSTRCPKCSTGHLNTPTILVRLETRRRCGIPLRICRHCHVIILGRGIRFQGWKIWNGTAYLDV